MGCIWEILPKGAYLPCVSMAGRALLAGYPHLWYGAVSPSTVYTITKKILLIFWQKVYWHISADAIKKPFCSSLNMCIMTQFFLLRTDWHILRSQTALVFHMNQLIEAPLKSSELVEAYCRMYASVDWVNIGSVDGLLPDNTKPLPHLDLALFSWFSNADIR